MSSAQIWQFGRSGTWGVSGRRRITGWPGLGRGDHVHVAARSLVPVGADELLLLGGAL